MNHSDGSAPAWLFSFVDLAFLLLIAMTQLASEPGPDFGEIAVPQIRSDATQELPARATERWQLRIHERGADAAPPFELVLVDGGGAVTAEMDPAFTAAEVSDRLVQLHATKVQKPLLAPHANARSQDLLDALVALEQRWPSGRRATVARIFEGS
jgi:hypothetical protein